MPVAREADASRSPPGQLINNLSSYLECLPRLSLRPARPRIHHASSSHS